VNLAITLARSGKKVLVIDADLRKQRFIIIWCENKEGLTNLLTDSKEEVKIKTTERSDISNLYIITSGPIPPNPAEMLNSNRMKSLLEKVRRNMILLS